MAQGKFIVTSHITDGPEIGEVVHWDLEEAAQIPWALDPVAEPKDKVPAKKAARNKPATKKKARRKAARTKAATDNRTEEEGK